MTRVRPVRSGTGEAVAPGNTALDQCGDGVGVARGDLEHQSRRGDTLANRRQQCAVGVEAILTTEQSVARLEVTHVAIHRLELLGGDVGRVADDEVEPSVERIRPRGLDKGDVDVECHRVGSGHVERRATDVGRDHAHAGDLGGKRDRDAAAPGPEVGDTQLRDRAVHAGMRQRAATSVSVSGRGTSTSRVTVNGRP